jgi:lipopolysaccharide export system ATP-binding protein
VLDLFAWFRRKGGQSRNAPGGGRRSIARPVSGPMFTGRVETMSYQRNPPQNLRDPRVRQEPRLEADHDPRQDLRQAPRQDPRQELREDARYDPRQAQRQASREETRQEPRQERRQELRQEPRHAPQPDQDRYDRSAPEAAGYRHANEDGGGAAWQPSPQGYLAAHGVERSFVGRKVVKGVSLYVRRGEAVGLLGPNGAGKTTVFYMITGLITADRGRIELDGHDVTGLPMYQRARLGIGYLPQEASIFRGLNVEQNIRAVLELVEPSRKRREYDLDALLDEFNITRLRKTPSIALSGGERRRVEIARALATRPNYMLLDEPFAGIDPIAVGDIQALVRHLTQRGIGVLVTDHNVRETLGLTDRAYIIYSGEVLMEGRAEDIVNNPDVRRLYLGEDFSM